MAVPSAPPIVAKPAPETVRLARLERAVVANEGDAFGISLECRDHREADVPERDREDAEHDAHLEVALRWLARIDGHEARMAARHIRQAQHHDEREDAVSRRTDGRMLAIHETSRAIAGRVEYADTGRAVRIGRRPRRLTRRREEQAAHDETRAVAGWVERTATVRSREDGHG